MVVIGSVVGVVVLVALLVKKEVLSKCFGVSRNIVTEHVEKKLDSVVDIKREGKEIINQLQKQEDSIRKALEGLVLEVKKAESNIELLTMQNNKRQEAAKIALRQGKEDDTFKLLNQIQNDEIIIESCKGIVNMHTPLIQQQIKFCSDLELQRQQLNAEIVSMDLQEKAYKAAAMFVDGDTKTTFSIDELRQRVTNAKTLLETKQYIKQELSGNTTQLENKYVSSNMLNVQERFKQLQLEVGGKVISEQ